MKNLERVQGDERDAIILSIGDRKDASGTLPYRFGPLLTEGGERRLNVAITRAGHESPCLLVQPPRHGSGTQEKRKASSFCAGSWIRLERRDRPDT